MFPRLTHAAIAFAVTTVLYQCYVVAVTPFVEPPRADRSPVASPVPTPAARGGVRYRELFAAYLPAGHWALAQPRTLDNGQVIAAIDAYDQGDDGKIRVNRCVMLFFPRPRDPSAPPPRDAVVVEAPQGAVLQLDSPAGLSGGAWGDLQYAQLLGKIDIRSDMSAAGPEDDLRLTVSDLRITDDLIQTNEAVSIDWGPHHASGRKLEIRLLPQDRGGDRAGLFGGLESLEITHDVYVQAALADDDRPIARDPGAGPEAGAADAGAGPALGPADGAPAPLANAPPPLRVKSLGPFTFDFANYVATFVDDVTVRQFHADGTLDELAASQLHLYFDPAAGRDAADPRGAERNGASVLAPRTRLEPASIEAKGKPFTLKAPSRQAEAQGQRLWIEIGPRRVTVEGGEEVRLKFRGQEVQAPFVQYQHPAEGSAAALGTLLATGGGRLSGPADAERGAGQLDIRWSEQLRLDRRGDRPVLSLWGRPWLSLAGWGQMWADRLEVELRESGSPPGDAARPPLPWKVAPDRLAASGHVAIDAALLSAATERLDVAFQYLPAAGEGQPAAGEAAAAPWAASSPQRAARHFEVTGRRLQVTATVRGDRPQASALEAEGDVVLREADAGEPSREPLRIAAQHVQVTDADTPDAQIAIRGGAGGAAAQLVSAANPPALAQIAAGDAVLRVPQLVLKRSASEASVDAPGEVDLPLQRDLSGRPLPGREQLTIRWQRSMRLQGATLEFSGNVLAQHASGWLQTPRLVVQLTEPVRFDGGAGRQRPDVARLECWEGVMARVQQSDEVGPTAQHRLRMENLILDQLTGALSGAGPGKLESVRLTANGGSWTAALPADSPASAGQRLRFLGIDFLQGVQGNLHRRELEAIGGVRTIDGPVDSWEQRLEMLPSGAPGPDSLWITCDRLGVAESPAAPILAPSASPASLGPIELTALGHVVIEGDDPQRGAFIARGQRASYSQQKSAFVLEGDGTGPATISHQQYAGAPFSTSSARKLSYDQRTGDIKVEGINRMEWNQLQSPRP